jgi:saccharopine dehydrogenase (NAD+, L-lysine-forming)
MKVSIVGAGGQGGACASILARNEKIEKIRLLDIDEKVVANIRDRITVGQEKVEIGVADATDEKDMAKNVAGSDVVIDTAMPWMVPDVMRGALEVGANYINSAFDTPFWEECRNGATQEELTLFAEFKAAGLTALLGCGFAPGWTNVLARRFANRLDTVDSIRMRVSKTASVPGELPYDWLFRPWNPGWSPKQALIDCASPTFAFENGEFVEYAPYAGIEMCRFPDPMGEQPVTHHSHEENYSMPLTFKDVKNVEFKYNLQPQPAIFYTTGLLSQEKKDIGGVKVAPLDVVASCIASPGANVFGLTDEHLEYADRTAFVELIVEVSGAKNGAPVTWRANCPKMNAPGPALKKLFGTALVYVALPLSVGAVILGEQPLPKGIIFADQLDPEDFIERMLATGYPYQWKESEV